MYLKKIYFKNHVIYIIVISILFSCNKENFILNPKKAPNLPELILKENNIKESILIINIGSNSTDLIKGICFSEIGIPTIADKVIYSNTSENSYEIKLKWSNTSKYKIRAFSKNSMGVSYSNLLELTWSDNNVSLPVIDISSYYTTSFTSIKVTGKVIENINDLSFLEAGFCLSFNNNPTLENSLQIANAYLVNKEANIEFKNLNQNTQYYVNFYCKTLKGITYSNSYAIKTFEEYNIGDKGPSGGTIIYKKSNYSNIWNFIEVADQDVPNYYKWGLNDNRTNIISKDLETGYSNTSAMLEFFNESGQYSALVAKQWIHNGYNDWYLPSIHELILVKELFLKNKLNLTDNIYWSSSEDQNFTDRAWVIRIVSTSNTPIVNIFTQSKISNETVRPIRRF
jgi:hypothetical protein